MARKTVRNLQSRHWGRPAVGEPSQVGSAARVRRVGLPAARQDATGKPAESRSGFQQLLESIAAGKIGAVSVSEIAPFRPDPAEWQELLSLCRAHDTIVVIDGVLQAEQ